MNLHSNLRTFAPSILLALTLHVALFYFISYIHFSLFVEKDRTIPILLLSKDLKAKKSNTHSESNSQHSSAARDMLSTTGSTEFVVQNSLSKPVNKKQAPNEEKSGNDLTQLPSLPTITDSTRSQSERVNQTRQGLKNIFSKQSQKQQHDLKQISTRTSKLLSDYEILLIKQLVRADLYDRYHAFMTLEGAEKVDFEIALVLFKNGAVKSAGISKTSDIAEIDRLAIRTAYTASPYPPPPKEDAQRGFKYFIPITYQKRK